MEKCKRKYEAKVKRLESQLQEMALGGGGGGGCGGDAVKGSLPSPNRSQQCQRERGGDSSSSNPMTSSVTMCKPRAHHTKRVPETTL